MEITRAVPAGTRFHIRYLPRAYALG